MSGNLLGLPYDSRVSSPHQGKSRMRNIQSLSLGSAKLLALSPPSRVTLLCTVLTSQSCSPFRGGYILEEGDSLSHSPAGADSVTDAIKPSPRAELCPSRSDSLSPANVTLDPDTAHPRLVLSEGGKSVRWGDTRQRLPDTPERFDSSACVLGCEGFTTGRHCWEVEVGGGGSWAVGVARESVGRKGWISHSPEGGIWAVERCGGRFQALTSPATPLPRSRAPSRIRVCLDCDRGQVTFIDAGDEAPIFTFPPGSVPGERIRPWLGVGPGSQLRLRP
ncbi:unnamed protein product [Lepidochelys olivacea]